MLNRVALNCTRVSRPVLQLVLGRRFYQIPTTTRKTIPVYPPIDKEPPIKNATLLEKLSKTEIDTNLDTEGWRFKLIDRQNKDHIKAGDILRVVYNKDKCSYDNFIGYILSVDRKDRTQDASVLLRNQITKVMVEVRVPLFSPLVQRIDILKRADGSRKRNKHYYIRGTKLDVGNLESKLRKKT